MPGDRGDRAVQRRRLAGRHPSRVGRRRAGAGVAPARARHLRRRRAGAGAGQARVSTRSTRIAVTQGPGLVGSLLVGVSFAKSLAAAREASARAGAPSGRAHRVAVSPERPVAAAVGRARRVRRAHEPVSGARRPASTACSGERAMTPRARRTTRSPSCSDLAIRADPSSIAWPGRATIARSTCR